MYAVIKTGGKQYKVEEGQTLLVEKLGQEAPSGRQLFLLRLTGHDRDGDPPSFDPADASRRFRLGAGDYLAYTVLPPLIADARARKQERERSRR